MREIREIADFIKNNESFVISTHVSPEGDAVGSAVGLALALLNMGKKASVVMADPVPEFLNFLPGLGLVTRTDRIEGSYDALIVVDCEPERTGLKDLDKAAVKTVINIDHHITNPKTAPLCWVNPDAAAAGEMVYDLVLFMGAPVDLGVATNLYTAIFTDTGSFRYSNTDEDALIKAGRLLAYGVNTWEISENVYESKSFGRMKLLGLVLGGIEMSADGRLAWVSVKEEYYKATGTGSEDTDGFINYPRAVKGVEVALLFREAGQGRVKVSFRSKGRVNVSGLAESLGGGGHPNASGAVMDGAIDEVSKKVVAATAGLLKEVFAG